MTPARWASVLLWVVPALWSTNYLIARAAEGVIAPHALAFGRWGLAALLLLPLTLRGLLRQRDALRREWKHSLVLGALGMWICGAWMYHGGQRTSATNMALIYAVTPIAQRGLKAIGPGGNSSTTVEPSRKRPISAPRGSCRSRSS